MITISKIENSTHSDEGVTALVELRGLSTDDKPTEVNGSKIENGSMFIEIDTGKIYMYDLENEQWKEM